jgi:hypothetical protein
MGYSIHKYGSLLLADIEDLGRAKEEANYFVKIPEQDYIEIRNSEGETVTVGYFDGKGFHWTEDKILADAWKSCSSGTKPPLWMDRTKPEKS